KLRAATRSSAKPSAAWATIAIWPPDVKMMIRSDRSAAAILRFSASRQRRRNASKRLPMLLVVLALGPASEGRGENLLESPAGTGLSFRDRPNPLGGAEPRIVAGQHLPMVVFVKARIGDPWAARSEGREAGRGGLVMAAKRSGHREVEALPGLGKPEAEPARLLEPEVGELVVIRGPERRLAMANQIDLSHGLLAGSASVWMESGVNHDEMKRSRRGP